MAGWGFVALNTLYEGIYSVMTQRYLPGFRSEVDAFVSIVRFQRIGSFLSGDIYI